MEIQNLIVTPGQPFSFDLEITDEDWSVNRPVAHWVGTHSNELIADFSEARGNVSIQGAIATLALDEEETGKLTNQTLKWELWIVDGAGTPLYLHLKGEVMVRRARYDPSRGLT